MLADFQQALADLVASPALCRKARSDPGCLSERYRLTKLEFDRLAAMVQQPGMRCNCTVYRANRLAPLALNLNHFCKALGDRLTPLVEEFWQRCPETSVNFLEECSRFCAFIRWKRAHGLVLDVNADRAFESEETDLSQRMQTILSIL